MLSAQALEILWKARRPYNFGTKNNFGFYANSLLLFKFLLNIFKLDKQIEIHHHVIKFGTNFEWH